MVRVNLVDPKLLTNEHLYAENVELDMLLKFIEKYPEGNIPDSYRMGKGHMSFFRDKIDYIYCRKTLIEWEIKARKGLASTMYPLNCKWTASEYDKQVNVNRIVDRLRNPLRKKNKWHYYGKEIDDIEQFIQDKYNEWLK